MGVERCDGERRIERVFRLVVFIKNVFLFVLFSCGCNNNLCMCVGVWISQCLYRKRDLISISEDFDWCAALCHSLFSLQLKYMHYGTLTKRQRKRIKKTSLERKRKRAKEEREMFIRSCKMENTS